MRKVYSKPCLTVEFFQLNAALAASCSAEGKTTLNQAENSCSDAFGTYFSSLACEYDIDEEEKEGNNPDGICYHAPVVLASALFLQS